MDFDITQKQRLSYVFSYGVRKNVPFTVGSNVTPTQAGVVLPLPYTAGGYATIVPLITDVEDNYQISNSMSNQFKFGFNRFSQPISSLTDNVAPYRASADIGISNLPVGQASTEFPGATFSANTPNPTPEAQWTSVGATGADQTTVPNTFTLLDNFLLVKGRHSPDLWRAASMARRQRRRTTRTFGHLHDDIQRELHGQFLGEHTQHREFGLLLRELSARRAAFLDHRYPGSLRDRWDGTSISRLTSRMIGRCVPT